MRTRRVEPWPCNPGLDNSTGNSTATRQEDSSGSTEPRQLVRQQCSTARTQQTRGERGERAPAAPPLKVKRLSLQVQPSTRPPARSPGASPSVCGRHQGGGRAWGRAAVAGPAEGPVSPPRRSPGPPRPGPADAEPAPNRTRHHTRDTFFICFCTCLDTHHTGLTVGLS